ncbi:hypothetical protein ADH76_05975 [Enterocloster clostridioformis]|uniref:BtrH N-terminal domain-containing protein n=1 Tax=Enterocloster clostridioformis TaxID=1531 RepID=UPI00080C4CA0|nr:BtrH N-terminal domain-containing protein [Enterocloster clostridioformis]ANU50045.1 hypothetical protein A4V08_33735 [Lachnoclostridium sp. YL32]NDO28463.1 hypothetical protein [Enterocloster clostridioformis]OXE70892.1 hypothetical protein ADH76_05975 [Enterocloster clostridioformis]QQR01051.1 hypothetical protein I5Q83_00910 [Enterocloster clostridioformis]
MENVYITYQGYECLNSCIVNRMRSMGYELSGSDIFFIGGGSDFKYKLKKNNKFVVANREFEADFIFCKKVGLDYSVKHIDEINCIDILERLVDHLGCVTVDVSTLYLKYHKIFANVDEYHFINVLKVDRENDRVYISDGYIPAIKLTVYEGWMPLAELLRSWKKSKYKVFIIRGLQKKNTLDTELKNSYKYMQKSVENYLARKDNKKIIEVYKYILKQIENSSLFADMVFSYQPQLKVYGFLAYKYYILQQIKKGNPIIYEEYKRIVNKWDAWLMDLARSGITCDYKKSIHVYERGNELVNKEANILMKIVTPTN